MSMIYQTLLYVLTLNCHSYGYPYFGCFKDSTRRVLPHHSLSLQNMTNTVCRNHCCSWAPYTYFGTQDGKECFCGSNSTRFKETSHDCKTPCLGNRSEMCGGHWTISIYEALCPTNESKQTTTQKIISSEKPDECVCSCSQLNRKIQSDDIESKMANLKKELSVNKRNTSTYRRTKTSSRDDRLSSKAMGIVAIVTILLPVVLAVINDFLNCLK